MDRQRYIESYLPVLEEFARETKDTFQKGYHEGVFIPYAFDGYWDSVFKVFYVGQDTAYWLTNEDEKKGSFYYGNELFIKHRDKNTLAEYLKLNAECVTAEQLINGDVSGVFWDFIQKLHIRLCTGEFKGPLAHTNIQDRMLINNVGYGEAYCVELPASLAKEYKSSEECWADNDWECYKSVAKAAEKIADIKLLLDTYQPDLIVITAGGDQLSALSNIDDRLEIKSKDDMLTAFSIDGYKTKLIWTYHPLSLKAKGYCDEMAINAIAQAYENLLR